MPKSNTLHPGQKLSFDGHPFDATEAA